MRAYPISDYPAKCRQAAAIMHMIMNNLDPRVAQVNNYMYYTHNNEYFAIIILYSGKYSREKTFTGSVGKEHFVEKTFTEC